MDSCRQDWAPRGKLQWIPPKGVALGTSAEDGGRVLGTEGPGFLIFLKKYLSIMYISCVCLVPEEDMGYPRRDYEQLGTTRWMKSSKSF